MYSISVTTLLENKSVTVLLRLKTIRIWEERDYVDVNDHNHFEVSTVHFKMVTAVTEKKVRQKL